MKLDGTEDLKPTPFDAHEQIVRKPHTHSLADGYKLAPEKPAVPEWFEAPKKVKEGE